MTKLKIIVSAPCSFAGVDFSSNEEKINNAIKEGHTVVTISYLHGTLERVMGYDIGACLNAEECVKDEKYIEGIYDAEVLGYPNTCKAFLWNAHDMLRGLIVDPGKEEDLKFAEEKYYNKEWNL